MTTVTYTSAFGLTGNRPMADVYLQPSHPNSSVWVSLVDTGADYLQLPAAAAKAVGISLSGVPTQSVQTAGGTVSLPFVANLDVEIEGYVVKADVLFDPSSSSSVGPLLGRQALLAAYEVGFNASAWLAR